MKLHTLPLRFVKSRRGCFIKKSVFTPLVQSFCGRSPVRSRFSRGLDDKAIWDYSKFDLIFEANLLDKRLWDANSARIADAHEPGLHVQALY
jgi:hypothetical protein